MDIDDIIITKRSIGELLMGLQQALAYLQMCGDNEDAKFVAYHLQIELNHWLKTHTRKSDKE
jgi:hypothetical protein